MDDVGSALRRYEGVVRQEMAEPCELEQLFTVPDSALFSAKL